MKDKLYKLFFLTLLILCASCVKENNAPTVLNIQCNDDLGYPTPGVAVNVYANYSDWLNNANVAYSGYTDVNGNVSFSGLYPQVYYFYCDDVNNCLTNWGVYETNGPVLSHTNNNISVLVSPTGTLKVLNADQYSDPYEVKVDNQVWINNLEYNNFAKESLQAGDHFVEFIQLNGPGYFHFHVQIDQCLTTEQDVP